MTHEELEAIRERDEAGSPGWALSDRGALLDEVDRLTTRQAEVWQEGYVSGHSRAMRRMSDEPNVEPGTNPYQGVES